MSYRDANEAKTSFDSVYTARTPHAYVAAMAKHGYEIGEQARPYCAAAAELLNERNSDAWPVQMLDVGCSYGIGSAFVKYGCSFDEMVAFFASRAPEEYTRCCEATRMWLNVTPPVCDVRSVGLDSAQPAIRFGVESGLLDGGIAKDLEDPETALTEEEEAWFRSCNLLISTGAVGYVTERTFSTVLQHLSRDNPGGFGPVAVITILRIFEANPVREAFERCNLAFGPVPEVRLPQRAFADDEECKKVLKVLSERGIDTEGWEREGKMYADLYVGARAEDYPLLLARMRSTHSKRAKSREPAGYICR